MSNTPANTSSCRYCGKELDSGKDFCKYCGTTTYNESCPFCKTSIPAGAIVCPGCGAQKAKDLRGCVAGILMVLAFLFFLIGIPTLFFASARVLGIILVLLGCGMTYIIYKYFNKYNGSWSR